MPKLKKYRKKTEPLELAGIENGQEQHRILKTIEATERFVLCASIAMGLTQMMALTPSIAKTVRKHRYLRTSLERRVFCNAGWKSKISSFFFRNNMVN